MVNIEFKLTGDITAGLDKLAESVGEDVLRSAGYAGAKVLQEEVKVRAPVASGLLRDNVIIKRDKSKSNGATRQTYLILVGKVVRKYANTRANVRAERVGKEYELDGKPFYWKFFEFGTSKMAARPFLRPAYDSRVNDAFDAVRAKLRERLNLK